MVLNLTCLFQTGEHCFEKSKDSDGEHSILSFLDLLFNLRFRKSIDIFVYTLLKNCCGSWWQHKLIQNQNSDQFPSNKLSISRQTPSGSVPLIDSNSPPWKTWQAGLGHEAESRVGVSVNEY